MPNSTQTQTTLAPMIAFLAGLLAGKGVFGFDTTTWTIILGGIAGVAVTIWTAIVTRKQAIVNQAITSDKGTVVNSVANMPEVRGIELDKNAPGAAALNNATVNNVVMK